MDGTCVPAGEGGATDAGSGDGAAPGDGGAPVALDGGAGQVDDGGTAPVPDAGAPLCDPTFGPSLSRAQVPVGPGLAATFEVAEDAGFDTSGTSLPDGGLLWDMSGHFSNDHAVVVQTVAPSGSWFGAAFPGASYAVPISDLSPNLGVFSQDASAIDLVGVASPSGGSGDTELTYATPVPVLEFPLGVGASWQTTSTVSGTLSGVPGWTWVESYTFTADETGVLVLPGGTRLPVLRVRADLTRVGAMTQRSYAFVTPCFGTVATVVSQPDELSVEFQSASELRRLAAP